MTSPLHRFLLPVVLLGGCASTSSINNDPYVPALGLDTATLVIKNGSSYPVSMMVFEDGAKCSRGTRPATEGASGGQRGRMNVAESVSIAVPSGKEFAVSFRAEGIVRDLVSHRCTMVGSFVPRAGATYTARFGIKGSTCLMGIVRIPSASESKELEVSELTFRLKRQVGSQCETDWGAGLLTTPMEKTDPKYWDR